MKREGMSNRLRFLVMERDGFKCVLCGCTPREDGVKLEIDHRIPVTKGGKTKATNLWTLCFSCNRGKFNHIATLPDIELVDIVKPSKPPRKYYIPKGRHHKIIGPATSPTVIPMPDVLQEEGGVYLATKPVGERFGLNYQQLYYLSHRGRAIKAYYFGNPNFPYWKESELVEFSRKEPRAPKIGGAREEAKRELIERYTDEYEARILLIERRVRMGLGRPALAKAVNLSYSTLSQIETGRRKAQRANIMILAEYLGLSFDNLVALVDATPADRGRKGMGARQEKQAHQHLAA